ncbi:hypothetical protein PVK06_012377 [Gossypium arboreum]|uniref:Uncharacterized protein n=1 Tax=Gossypium arboreum TaxID=29729 RepID=A0ABR0QC33_GOSAR|nr:hypothetical protein PVK06_012377 [Gossypium arboreum]
MSDIVDMGASNLFILEKAMGKLGHLVRKFIKKIKIANSIEVPKVRVVQGVELQIGKWKGKEEFKSTDLRQPQLDDSIDLVTLPSQPLVSLSSLCLGQP